MKTGCCHDGVCESAETSKEVRSWMVPQLPVAFFFPSMVRSVSSSAEYCLLSAMQTVGSSRYIDHPQEDTAVTIATDEGRRFLFLGTVSSLDQALTD